ncbi:hypothetical protein ACH5RR_006627 [Cinchona calisaya]|uniref:Uncharacterized protein n=1 Tax=Cinchona calisaya TaxID=153742 RepID=A0ABD3APU3_9GENT
MVERESQQTTAVDEAQCEASQLIETIEAKQFKLNSVEAELGALKAELHSLKAASVILGSSLLLEGVHQFLYSPTLRNDLATFYAYAGKLLYSEAVLEVRRHFLIFFWILSPFMFMMRRYNFDKP